MSNLQFDPEVSRQIESVYTTPDVIEQRRVVRASLALRPGDRVLDVGVGPGLLAAEMAAEVGPDGRVCGIDISDSMLSIAATRADVTGGPPIELGLASAGRIPHGPGSFDVVVSTQVLEYVDDVPGALDEIRRVLRPGGRVVLLDTDWGSIVWRSGDNTRMQRGTDRVRGAPVGPVPAAHAGGFPREGGLHRHAPAGRADAERGLRPANLQRRASGHRGRFRPGP
jgi:arsenite methyltransferase